MTPLLTALSSLRDASRISTPAVSRSPASTAAWYFRIAVFSDDLTALLRSRAFSFCLLRLIWDLMFATRQPSCSFRRSSSDISSSDGAGPHRSRVLRLVRRARHTDTPHAKSQSTRLRRYRPKQQDPPRIRA